MLAPSRYLYKPKPDELKRRSELRHFRELIATPGEMASWYRMMQHQTHRFLVALRRQRCGNVYNILPGAISLFTPDTYRLVFLGHGFAG